MAQYRGEFVTQWVYEGGKNRMQVGIDHSVKGLRIMDATGTPARNVMPNPNAVVVFVVMPDAATLKALQSDTDVVELWSEEIAESV